MAGLCAWDGERLLVDISVFCVCSCTVLEHWSCERFVFVVVWGVNGRQCLMLNCNTHVILSAAKLNRLCRK